MVKHYQERQQLNLWKSEVGKETIFACVGSVKMENLFWQIVYGRIPPSVKMIVVRSGTNFAPEDPKFGRIQQDYDQRNSLFKLLFLRKIEYLSFAVVKGASSK